MAPGGPTIQAAIIQTGTQMPDQPNLLFIITDQHDRVREMAGRVKYWQKRTGDTTPLAAV